MAQRLVDVVSEATPPVRHEITLTMSAAYATCSVHGDTLDTVFNAADQALLRAKEAGRNRVEDPLVVV